MRLATGMASLCASALIALAGCAWGPLKAPQVPASLRPAAGQSLFLEARASGVQIYECSSKAEAPDTFAWNFVAPEAQLADRSGRPIGRHYAGPTWELRDGSSVVGAVVARDPGPDTGAIPWLLLEAKSTSGTGTLTRTRSIQRVRTVGGVAPLSPCTQALAHTVIRVPYTATYYFYQLAR
jgi:hypothetical protein